MMLRISVGIVDYPGCTKSACYGLQEMLTLANQVCITETIECEFAGYIIDSATLPSNELKLSVIILPPGLIQCHYSSPEKVLIAWLQQQHKEGSMLASACAGSFILAATGLLEHKQVTTHWNLELLFRQHYPNIDLNINQIVVGQGDVITAGGMMSWLDLGLALIAQFASPHVMRCVGKRLVVDTGFRQQQYYRQFLPNLQHGDRAILITQHHLLNHYNSAISIPQLAALACMGERNFLRRFRHATGFPPSKYLQQLRVQKACDLLETTMQSFEWIASTVGFENTGACRKLFIKHTGLSPKEFRKRFKK